MSKESKKDRQYEKLFSGKKHNSAAWNKAMVQNTMHEAAKHSALKKKTEFNHEKIGRKAAKRRNSSTVEHRMDDYGRSVPSQ